jgi:hypothetical protein
MRGVGGKCLWPAAALDHAGRDGKQCPHPCRQSASDESHMQGPVISGQFLLVEGKAGMSLRGARIRGAWSVKSGDDGIPWSTSAQ